MREAGRAPSIRRPAHSSGAQRHVVVDEVRSTVNVPSGVTVNPKFDRTVKPLPPGPTYCWKPDDVAVVAPLP